MGAGKPLAVTCPSLLPQVVALEAGRVVFVGSPAAYLASSHALLPAPASVPAALTAAPGGNGTAAAGTPRGKASLPASENGGLSLDGPAAALAEALGGELAGVPQRGGALEPGEGEPQDEEQPNEELTAEAEIEEEEEREEGHVRWAVWARYGSAVGRRLALAVLLSLALMQVRRCQPRE